MQGQELDLMNLGGPFQLRTFYISMLLPCTLGTTQHPGVHSSGRSLGALQVSRAAVTQVAGMW